MTPLSTLEAYDLLRHCALLADRLADEEVLQLSRAGLELEKVWLSQACVLVQTQRPGLSELLARARELPELELVREDYSEELQDAWVDALEKLHAGLVLHTSSRAPIVETLFPHVKFPALRRASAEAMRAYSADLERRSRLGYVKRIFGQPEYEFVEPLVLAVFETLERWEACFRPSEMPEEVAIPLREELAAAAYRVERTMRQAKLLAEAALTPIEGAFDASGIGARVRRRVGTVETEVPPALDGEPVDDGVPLAEALGWGGRSEGEPQGADGASPETAEGEAHSTAGEAANPDEADAVQSGSSTPGPAQATNAPASAPVEAEASREPEDSQPGTPAASAVTPAVEAVEQAATPEEASTQAATAAGAKAPRSKERAKSRTVKGAAPRGSRPAAGAQRASDGLSGNAAAPLDSAPGAQRERPDESEHGAAAPLDVDAGAQRERQGESERDAAAPLEVDAGARREGPGESELDAVAPLEVESGAQRESQGESELTAAVPLDVAASSTPPSKSRRSSARGAKQPQSATTSGTGVQAAVASEPVSAAPVTARPPKRRRAQAPAADAGPGEG